ncbi:MAG: hypothetical protein HYV07_25225 [Deltaproteobacteria bacterium]|nr:hypothetical protein [Deltaproteobacteria bacterium]
MRALAVLFVVLAGCYTPCKISSSCAEGEHCDFRSGSCVPGCTSDDDCTGTCDELTGRCLAKTLSVSNPDATVPDASTSSVADAGP